MVKVQASLSKYDPDDEPVPKHLPLTKHDPWLDPLSIISDGGLGDGGVGVGGVGDGEMLMGTLVQEPSQ